MVDGVPEMNNDKLIDKAFDAIPWIVGGYIIYKIVTGAKKGTGGGGEAKGQ